jgi:Na+/proline symporter
MLLIFGGLIVAFFVIVAKIPHGVSFTDALRVAGSAGRMQAIDYSINPKERYTLWSGIFGGVFLSLAYFGTDQSQVQRYLSGSSVRGSRLGLMFNAVLKIPMQFFILLLGTLVFAFYQFEPHPLFFNQPDWRSQAQAPGGQALIALDNRFAPLHEETAARIREWLAARQTGDAAAESSARAAMLGAEKQTSQLHGEAVTTLAAIEHKQEDDVKDTDYVFLTFILHELPHGVIGLLIAVIFAGGLASISSELNALGSTTAVDFYRNLWRPDATDAHSVFASKMFTAWWGLIALAFAFFCQFADNLIQAVNLVGSLFYGPVLGLFLIAFFFKRINGSAAFWGAILAQALVIGVHLTGQFAYLWYNPIGVGACVLVSLALQLIPGFSPRPEATRAST